LTIMKQGPVFHVDYYDGMETWHYLRILIPKFIIFEVAWEFVTTCKFVGQKFHGSACFFFRLFNRYWQSAMPTGSLISEGQCNEAQSAFLWKSQKGHFHEKRGTFLENSGDSNSVVNYQYVPTSDTSRYRMSMDCTFIIFFS
jgi:hypothetical protein